MLSLIQFFLYLFDGVFNRILVSVPPMARFTPQIFHWVVPKDLRHMTVYLPINMGAVLIAANVHTPATAM